MPTEVVSYTPPPTIRAFIMDYRPGELFYDWIIGPVGSGKTTGLFFKLVYMAQKQAPSADGIRRTRAVVVRNTAPQLKDTTLKSWDYWFKAGQAGDWKATEKNFTLRFGDVECEVLFRPLDTPDDVDRVLSLEITFAIVDEFVQIPRSIIDALSARLGRYPSRKDGGATNWGMWGSSNPDTEDNWWHDYLNGPDVQRVTPEMIATNDPGNDDLNAKYFHQPSGFSAEAENLDNLPPYDGSNAYYINQAKGKKKTWVKQYLDAEWGFSADGQPVVATFNGDYHVSKERLRFNPAYPLVLGLDPGLAGSAIIFGQEDLHGRLLVLAELVQANYGAERLITELLKPFLRKNFPNADIIIAPDPAADNRAQTDERAVADVFRKHFPGRVKIETNNRLEMRLNAIDSYTTRLTDIGPALVVDGQACPKLVRALSGGWRYQMVTKGDIQKPMPEKNGSSHVGDAFGYLARFFHKQYEKGGQRGLTSHERAERIPQSKPVRYSFQ